MALALHPLKKKKVCQPDDTVMKRARFHSRQSPSNHLNLHSGRRVPYLPIVFLPPHEHYRLSLYCYKKHTLLSKLS